MSEELLRWLDKLAGTVGAELYKANQSGAVAFPQHGAVLIVDGVVYSTTFPLHFALGWRAKLFEQWCRDADWTFEIFSMTRQAA